MALFNTNAFRITEQGLSVLWQKQQIIAQNIANQDTPGYNCKYLDFYAVLKDRMESTSVVGGKAKEGSKQVELATRVYEDTATNTQPDEEFNIQHLDDYDDESKSAVLKKEIKDFSRTNPDVVAQLIRSMMKNGE